MSKRTFHLWLTSLALALLWPRVGVAQLAPTGSHYAGRPSDTGHAGPNDRGGYAASIPLDLPPARGGLPIPLQIVSGTRGFGAAGVGWDIPLSYVHVDRSFARRRPMVNPGAPATSRERISVALPGRHAEMVILPQGDKWVGRHTPDLLMDEVDGAYKVFDGNGLTFTFTQDPLLAGTGIFLLQSIDGAGGARLVLGYSLASVMLPDATSAALAIDLVSVKYNPHPSAGCFKHELSLLYATPQNIVPRALSVSGEQILVRHRRITAVEVTSRASCVFAPERLRRYTFSYQPDLDTKQERLASVKLLGRQGTAEESVAVPVSAYQYGSATTAGSSAQLRFSTVATDTLPLPYGAPSGIASTDKDSSNIFQSPIDASESTAVALESFIDMTGDGRPDLVFHRNGVLMIARNVRGPFGMELKQPVFLNDATFQRPVLDARSSTHDRYGGPNDSAENHEHVWVQAVDVNGDGRLDVIDAAEKPGFWILYLNTPDDIAASGIKWVRRAYRIDRLYGLLSAKGMDVKSNYLPLSRRFTARDHSDPVCWKYSSLLGIYMPYPPSDPDCPLGTTPRSYRGPEKTFTEWEVRDLNGDGYPDFVFNSSPVALIWGVPSVADHPSHEPILGTSSITVRPLDPLNRVEAVLNVRGLFITDDATVATASDPFSAATVLVDRSTCGVGLWTGIAPDHNGEGPLPPTQFLTCAFEDINGDGMADRVIESTARLGTGLGFTGIRITLPGQLAKQMSTYNEHCRPDGDQNPFVSTQTLGLRDLTGDGIPDYISHADDGGFSVHVGTGAGFAPPVAISGPFEISHADEWCDGSKSRTARGLYDVDGDGVPERVTVSASQLNLDIYPLVGGSGVGALDAGRIVKIDNGYGATTSISYRSAKEDWTTAHQVPFPEIVVGSIETTGDLGHGGTLARTDYAYGGIELFYDSVADAFRPTGYSRRVELTSSSGPGYPSQHKTATVFDSYPLTKVNSWNAPFLTSKERFGRYLQVGRSSGTMVLAGDLGNDPWQWLVGATPVDLRTIAASHHDVQLVDTTLSTDGTPPVEGCMDVMFPYDYELSKSLNAGQYNLCTARGFLHTSATRSWRGTEAPPSANNVQAQAMVRSIDEYGRVTRAFHQNDVFRLDDDVCVDTTYATPTGSNQRVLTAVASRRMWSGAGCSEGNEVTLAEESWEYDKLPTGLVSQGLVTAHTVYRRATDTGAHIGTVREYDVDYDAAGNPFRITQARGDGATRTTLIDYDTFARSPLHASVQATGIPELHSYQSIDPVSDEVLSATDENGTKRGAKFDGFGRPRFETVTPPGGTAGVLTMRSYLGFSGGDPLGRRVVAKEFVDPVAEQNVLTEEGQISTTFLDELGRPRFDHVELGDDYANERLIVGRRTYDLLGRVSFQADPYAASQDPNTAYGTTQYYARDGSLELSIRGRGPQQYTTTPDPAQERYPALVRHTFANHTSSVTAQAADSLTSGSSQYGVTRETVTSAVGRVLTRSTWQNGTRLEHADFAHDRLGRQTRMVRYQNPSAVGDAVEWSWQLDSIGQVLELREPSSAPQRRTYSKWGELTRVDWTPALPEPVHSITSTYDALGRLIASEEQNGGVSDPATINRYTYDAPVKLSNYVTPTYVLGRLASATSPTGTVSFSYDAFGRVNARTHSAGNKNVFVEKHGFHADGSQAWLELRLPDNNFAAERVEYAYDSARRLRWMWSTDGVNTFELFQATKIDAFGRLRSALLGKNIEYTAKHAELGRRLPEDVKLSSGVESRYIAFTGFDAVGRELSRTEDNPIFAGTQSSSYDALGRVRQSTRTQGPAIIGEWTYAYDPLGNIQRLTNMTAPGSAFLHYQSTDRDRVCSISFTGLFDIGCNVVHDSVGNIIHEPTRTGYNKLAYFNSGDVRSIENQAGAKATFRYDPFGAVHKLDISAGSSVVRSDERYGTFINRRYQSGPGGDVTYISRQFPGPGLTISRRGPLGPWVYQLSEPRGARFTVDHEGRFVQDLDYTPFGAAESKGAQPGTAEFSTQQWNDGDALEQFGLVHLGARVYDPTIGRFLSRDPLLIPRTSATSNPYSFSFNDPITFSDASGLTPCIAGKTCDQASSYEPSLRETLHSVAAALGELVVDFVFDDEAGYARIDLQTAGPAAIAMWDTVQRAEYMSTIKSRSDEAVTALESSRARNNIADAESLSRRTSAERDVLREKTQRKLSPGGLAVSKRIDRHRPWTYFLQHYSKNDPFDTHKEIIKAAGRSNGWLRGLTTFSKVAAPLGYVFGFGAAGYNIANAPPGRRAEVAFVETAAIVGGGVGAVSGTTLGAGVGGMVAVALASNPAGWVVAGAVAGTIVGGYIGSTVGRAVAEVLSSPAECRWCWQGLPPPM